MHIKESIERRYWSQIAAEYPSAWRSIAILGVIVNLLALGADLQNVAPEHTNFAIGLRLVAAMYFAALGLTAWRRPQWLVQSHVRHLVFSYLFFTVTFSLISLACDGIQNLYFAAIIQTEFAAATFGIMPPRIFAGATVFANGFYLLVHSLFDQYIDLQQATNVTLTLAICAVLAIAFHARFIKQRLALFAQQDQIDALNRELAQRVEAQTASLRKLTNHLDDIREQERKLVSREIHDELGQLLALVSQSVYWLRDKLHASASDRDRRLALVQDMNAQAIATVRRIAHDLRPVVVEDLGLARAIVTDLEKLVAVGSIDAHWHIALTSQVQPDQAVGVYRIFQEAVTNVLRHAAASRLDVRLLEQGGNLHLTISDNGKGIHSGQNGDGLGLTLMRERAMQIAGKLQIKSNGNGTQLSLTMPLAVVNQAAAMTGVMP